jgi:hypothetical protein
VRGACYNRSLGIGGSCGGCPGRGSGTRLRCTEVWSQRRAGHGGRGSCDDRACGGEGTGSGHPGVSWHRTARDFWVWLLVMRCDRVSAPPVADKGRNSNSGRDVSLACVDGCSELGGSERTIGGCLHPDPLTSLDRGTLTLLFFRCYPNAAT